MNSSKDGDRRLPAERQLVEPPSGKDGKITTRRLRYPRKACDHRSVGKLQWQMYSPQKFLLRSNCPGCGRYLQFVHQTPENVEEARLQHNECLGCTWDEVPPVRTLPRARVACDHLGLRELQWHLFRNRRLHLKSSCCECGVHMGWAAQTFANLQEALSQRRHPINCTWDEVLARQPVEDPETVEVIEF